MVEGPQTVSLVPQEPRLSPESGVFIGWGGLQQEPGLKLSFAVPVISGSRWKKK